MHKISILACVAIAFVSCNNKNTTSGKDSAIVVDSTTLDFEPQEVAFNIQPISHATMVLTWNGSVVYIDPVGGMAAFEGQAEPDIILVTDIHGDHFNIETLEIVVKEKTHLFAPQAVVDELPEALRKKTMVLNNGNSANKLEFTITAIPMYNLPESEDSRHPKGRGNGYVIEKDKRRVYISGDTEDIPEMRQLENIDIAFVCMNLPYTMTVERAADAVLDFKPDTVYPYHYRGKDGLSDVDKFKRLVEMENHDIKVTQLDWYPKK
ncbi:MBL fold metallo-hydrolase [Altibacter sp.]|uniref:MBL fold metallo-hydrolase n=1 Tax=Altibacter sp. TaxID=2024823 RepID=UPI000C89EB59|nr:MBL fold metallo-hydrolase [Altibacter sp.]MAP55265.1 MBL fold metallo-hydrolase [Altibacter sp.]